MSAGPPSLQAWNAPRHYSSSLYGRWMGCVFLMFYRTSSSVYEVTTSPSTNTGWNSQDLTYSHVAPSLRYSLPSPSTPICSFTRGTLMPLTSLRQIEHRPRR